MDARVSARDPAALLVAAPSHRLEQEQKVGNLLKQGLINFLHAYRSEIVTRMPPEGTTDHYYFGGQLSLLDKLIVLIGEESWRD